jgi:hypothetical protein
MTRSTPPECACYDTDDDTVLCESCRTQRASMREQSDQYPSTVVAKRAPRVNERAPAPTGADRQANRNPDGREPS